MPDGESTSPMDELKQLIKIAEEGARKNLREKGEVFPVLIGMDVSKQIFLIGIDMPKEFSERDSLATSLRLLLKSNKCIAYIFISEIWYLQCNRRDNLEIRPSQSDAKQEAILITGATDGGEQVLHIFSIERLPDKPPTMTKQIVSEELQESNFSGRFCDLLD